MRFNDFVTSDILRQCNSTTSLPCHLLRSAAFNMSYVCYFALSQFVIHLYCQCWQMFSYPRQWSLLGQMLFSRSNQYFIYHIHQWLPYIVKPGRFWVSQFPGTSTYWRKEPMALTQKLSLVGSQCKSTVRRIKGVESWKFSCRGHLCNTIALLHILVCFLPHCHYPLQQLWSLETWRHNGYGVSL